MDNTPTLPLMLSGCRVLDFTQYLAGPTVTRLMAEMGAQIIKVEQAPMGDPRRLEARLPRAAAGGHDDPMPARRKRLREAGDVGRDPADVKMRGEMENPHAA